MAFTLPTFNLTAAVWRSTSPLTNPPDVICICNLALGRRIGQLPALAAQGGDGQGGMWLLVPKGTDIQDLKNGVGNDVVEVPMGSSRYYNSVWVDDVGLGFSNEHRFAELVAIPPWPVPFPFGGDWAGLTPGAAIGDGPAVDFAVGFVANVPAGTTGYYTVPVCCQPLYDLVVVGLAGAGTVATFAGPTTAPVADVAASPDGTYQSTFPPASDSQVFVQVVADPVLDATPTIKLVPKVNQVKEGGGSCPVAVAANLPLEGRVFVPFAGQRWFRLDLLTGFGCTLQVVMSDALSSAELSGGAACPGAVEVIQVGTGQAVLVGGAHTGPFLWLNLKPSADCVFTFRLF